jgi:hypothetical protein
LQASVGAGDDVNVVHGLDGQQDTKLNATVKLKA